MEIGADAMEIGAAIGAAIPALNQMGLAEHTAKTAANKTS